MPPQPKTNWITIILSATVSGLCAVIVAGVLGGVAMYAKMAALDQRVNDQTTAADIKAIRDDLKESEHRITDQLKETWSRQANDERAIQSLMVQRGVFPTAPAPAAKMMEPKRP